MKNIKVETKLDGIVPEESMQVIVDVLSTVEVDEKQKINLIETVASTVYCHREYFEKLTAEDKLKSITMLALVFNMLLDKEINPLASKFTQLALKAYNNNILSIGGAEYVF